jgi:hypothetical protein
VKRIDQYRELVWHSPDLTATEKLVALALSRYMDFDNLGGAHPGHAALARLTSLTTRTIERTIAELVTKEWLMVAHRGGSAKGGRRLASVYRGRLPTTDTVSPVEWGRLPTQCRGTTDTVSAHPLKDPRRPSRAARMVPLHSARYEHRDGNEIVTYDRNTNEEIARRAAE